MESRLDKRISGLEPQINELRERMRSENSANVWRDWNGLREAISGRVKAS